MKRCGLLATVIACALVVFAFPLNGSGAGTAGANPKPSLSSFAAQGSNLIRLAGGAFDPLSNSFPVGAPIRSVDSATLNPATPDYWLAQVRGVEFKQVTNAVSAAGGKVVGFIPDAAYIVRATPAQRDQIAKSASVRWIGYYQPAWRIPMAVAGKKGLLDIGGTQSYRVHVFRDEPDPASVGQALRAIPGVEVVTDDKVVVDIHATAVQLPAIAAISGVEWVGIKPTAVKLNANSRWVNDTGIRDVYAATAPGRLTGLGQTAAVADTGINYTYDLNGRAHVAFRDCDPSGQNCKTAIYTQTNPGTAAANMTTITNNNTNHRKVVAFFDLGNTGPNPFDESSHGSHTTGSVTGDAPPYNVYNGDDGLAPAAKLVSQNIGSGSGGLALPSDDYQLWRQAYRPRNPLDVATTSGATGNPNDYQLESAGGKYRPLEDARTHNNSYGLIAPVIDDGSAAKLDQFVWDHEDMTIAVSAGNSGPVPASIGSPSVAKNELSSGAGANGRQPMVSIDSVASFSSHGPTGDGRLGPDVITPGQIVVSVKGGSTDGYHVAQGTSMSSPVLTGLATLVRQYYWDGYGAANLAAASTGGGGFAAGAPDSSRQHNPSAALVKATLINGAVRMRGWYSGSDGDSRALDGQWPSEGQGFGRVNLDNSLYFSNDPSNLWYMDVYRGDTASLAACQAAGGTSDSSCTAFLTGVNASRSFTIHVEPGQPLDVTLAWTDFSNGQAAGSPALVNNLNLGVTGPGGAMYVGNNMNSRTNPAVAVAETANGAAPPDTKNLSERVRVANPAAGDYTITVNAPAIAVGNQGFALAASGNVSKPGGPAFAPGPALQVDQPGSPSISNVKVVPTSANTAKVTFDTNEPTSATATATVVGGPHTFVDSYNIGSNADWPGLTIGPVETSTDYANKPVVGSKHEILLTGLPGSTSTPITLSVKDLANPQNTTTGNATATTPSSVFQANAPDIGQLYQDPQAANDPRVGKWLTGTQMYASNNGSDGSLGAFMFRLPAAFDPATITGAAVELHSTHNWVIPYVGDPQVYVDLLPASVEANWGTQDYNTIHNATADARVPPESTDRRGAYQKYDFTFACNDLAKLKTTLTTVTGTDRAAAFRFDASQATPLQLFAMEFGFNRRSRGPDLRAKLILYTNNTNPTLETCDPTIPAPTISSIGIHDGLAAGKVTVSWETDVDSDSFVLFREIGNATWTQVGSPTRVRMHHVEVLGLDSTKQYEFVVRSAACNGAATTDTNGGQGYGFFRPPDPTFTRYFSGVPQDQANKLANTPTATFQAAAPASEPPIVQLAVSTFGQAGTPPDIFHNSRGTYWDGVVPGTIPPLAKITFHLFATSANGNVFATSPTMTLFKDGVKFHQEAIGLSVGPAPVDNLLTITLRPGETITAGQSLSVQMTTSFINNDWQIHYFAPSTPSRFSAQTAIPPSLPLAGPVPPPSAGDSGLTAPTLRTGAANAGDLAAGTGVCAVSGTTGVTVRSFAGRKTGRTGIKLTWRTASETNLLGFNVWRSAPTGKVVKVNKKLVRAKAAGRPGDAQYSLLDPRVHRGQYRYALQLVGKSGARTWSVTTSVRMR